MDRDLLLFVSRLKYELHERYLDPAINTATPSEILLVVLNAVDAAYECKEMQP